MTPDFIDMLKLFACGAVGIEYSGKNEINIENIKSITKDKDEIIISGSIEFIENVHKKIKECIENNSLQKENITIIDCYDINKVQSKIKELLELHDKILNTAGDVSEGDIYIRVVE